MSTENLKEDVLAEVGEVDELEYHIAVLEVAKYLNKTKMPKSKGPIALAIFDMLDERNDEDELTSECRKSRYDFIKYVVPKASEAIRKAKMGQSTEAEILHEKKAIAELKVVLRDIIAEQEDQDV